jgi:glycosyltransferase involved in cell wall biosynthesis
MGQGMRIYFVAVNFAPLTGGAESRAEKQARRMQALGHTVTVVTLRHQANWQRAETLDGLPVVRLGGLYRYTGRLRVGRVGIWPVTLKMLLTLWRRRASYDVLHVFQLSPLAVAAALVGHIARKPVVISIQNAGPSEAEIARLRQHSFLMADTLPAATFLDVNSRDVLAQSGDVSYLSHMVIGGRALLSLVRRTEAVYQVLSRRSRAYLTSHKFPARQIVHVSGSVDTDKFRPEAAKRPDPTAIQRVVTCVARLEYNKGVDVLLHAWARMMRPPDAWRARLSPRLQIVGEGTLKPQLERLIHELDIGESVELLGPRKDVLDLLQRSWGFVLPSRWEGMPNALLEAMACGVSCIATLVSGSEDLIEDGANGLLVQPEDPAGLAFALRRLLEDSTLTQRLGDEARSTVVRDYQLSSVVDHCLDLYRRLVAPNLEAKQAEIRAAKRR